MHDLLKKKDKYVDEAERVMKNLWKGWEPKNHKWKLHMNEKPPTEISQKMSHKQWVCTGAFEYIKDKKKLRSSVHLILHMLSYWCTKEILKILISQKQ